MRKYTFINFLYLITNSSSKKYQKCGSAKTVVIPLGNDSVSELREAGEFLFTEIEEVLEVELALDVLVGELVTQFVEVLVG